MPVSSIDGIATGLDTTSIVDALLTFDKSRVTNLQNDVTDRTNIISNLQALQAKLLALNTQVKQLTRASVFQTASVAVSDDSILSAQTTGKVGTGSYNVQVLSVAKNHQLASQGIASDTGNILGTGTINLQVGSGSQKTITIDASNNSLTGIRDAINGLKMGVTATIVNDGSSSSPYRLLLTADKTGLKSAIAIDANLTGGVNLDYENSSFETPEKLISATTSTSQISLGATAANEGSKNKTYTFTVDGTGTQTVGSDIITINWTDGTNSGSIAVTQADTEVALVGEGADGLKLNFAAGALTGGDVFQISSFSPLVQAASDAKIAFGGTDSNESPIIVTSDTNTFKSVIPGMSLNVLKKTGVGESVTVNASQDTGAVKDSIQSFIDAYNDVMKFINEQNSFDSDTESAGVLFGDYTLSTAASSITRALGSKISGIESNYNQLYSIGIRTIGSGQLAITNGSRLETALQDNLDDVIKLFTSSGSSSSNYVEYYDSTSKTKAGEKIQVQVTRAATQGALKGATITKPESTPIVLTSQNNRLRFVIDGLVSDEIILDTGTYSSVDSLIEQIQTKIDEDAKIGPRNVQVEWVEGGSSTGYIKITSPNYGSTSSVNMVTSIANSAFTILGLAGGISSTGIDVEGTLNGEAATGKGQILTGNSGNKTTDGLAVKVSLTSGQLTEDAEAEVTVARGIAGRLQTVLDSLTLSQDGLIDRRIKSYKNQIEDINARIDDYNSRMETKRQSLFERFYAMEDAISQLNSQGQYLSAQLSSLANLSSSRSGSSRSGSSNS